jgi:biofilm PGA synthesis N-glycosyltransferase PgaC
MTPSEVTEPITAASLAEPRHRKIYFRPGIKYLLAFSFALLWSGASIWVAQAWAVDLGRYASPVGGWIIVFLVAIIPGYVVALMGASLSFDRQPPFRVQHPDVPITIIVAAYNEENGIGITLERIALHDYAGPISVILANNQLH